MKNNFTLKEIIDIIKTYDIEKKLEIIKEEISNIIWELLDIFNNNKLFHDYLKIIVIDILLINIKYKIYYILDVSKDISNEIENYKEIIEKIKSDLYKLKLKINEIEISNENKNKIIEGVNENKIEDKKDENKNNIINENKNDIINHENENDSQEKEIQTLKNNCLNNIEKYENITKIKEFIIDFISLDDVNKINNENIEKCQNYIDMIFSLGFNLDSPELLKLQDISNFFEVNNTNLDAPNSIQDENRDYIEMFKKVIKGDYHGKKCYTDILDRNDLKNLDEKELAFKNLNELEQRALDIIDRNKSDIEKRIRNLRLDKYNKKGFFMIIKEFPKNWENYTKAQNYLRDNDLDGMIDYIISIYTNNEEPTTIKEFEERIKDDCILKEINSILFI